jgi:hypothetical protein
MISRRFVFFFAIFSIAGCDRLSSSSSGPGTGAGSAGSGQVSIELTPITPLLPRLRTHFAADSRGNLFWIQESDPAPAGGDLVFVMGVSGVPQTLPALTTRQLLGAIKSDDTIRATGAVRSMAIGPNDELFILFAGGNSRTPICSLFGYTCTTNKLRLIADTKQIMELSGMGASIDLARGSLVGFGHDLWLWLRHSDSAALLQINATDANTHFELKRFAIKPSTKIRAGLLTSDKEDLAAGPGQTLYYVDRPRAMLWKIDPNGEFSAAQSLEGFSEAVTAPAVDSLGYVGLIAGNGDPLVARDFTASGSFAAQGVSSPGWVQLPYPAFLQIQTAAGKTTTTLTIKRDQFIAPAALPVQDMQPRQLLLDRSTGTLITFDAVSGELLRLKAVRR